MLLWKRNGESDCVKRLIHIHLKSWQSVKSLNNQTCEWVKFFGLINIVVKSVFFLNKGTFTQILSMQDEQVILK